MLTNGVDTYLSVDAASAYLAKSFRAAPKWDLVDDDVREQCLASAFRMLERQSWAGAPSGTTIALAAATAAGGTGYLVGDVLTVTDGTGTQAQFEVATVGGGGAILTLTLLATGFYSTAPVNPANVSGGHGTGATLNLTTGPATTQFPRSGLQNSLGAPIDGTALPQPLLDAQAQLAFEISQDEDLESARSQDSNIKSIRAGSVAIDNFRPADQQGRFPFSVMELLRGLFGSGAMAPAAALNADGCPQFDQDQFRLSRPLP